MTPPPDTVQMRVDRDVRELAQRLAAATRRDIKDVVRLALEHYERSLVRKGQA